MDRDRGEQTEGNRQKGRAREERRRGRDKGEETERKYIGGETYKRWRERARRKQIERKRQKGETGEEIE